MNLFNYKNLQDEIRELDEVKVKDSIFQMHNSKYGKEHIYHFHENINPCPFEGDLLNAKVVLLLANPQYSDSTNKLDKSVKEDHEQIEGWGIWGLSSKSRKAMRDWWRPRLRQFVKDENDEEEWRSLSNRIASLQEIAWASKNFHECKDLPSKKEITVEVINQLVEKNKEAIYVVVRRRKYWGPLLKDKGVKVIETKNPRCSYISEGNFKNLEDWSAIKKALF